jgi:two-component system, OmpR family, sensor histidine kinase VicK
MQNPWELEDYYSKERIEVIHGKEETISLSLQAFVRSQKKIDVCADGKGPAVFVNVNPINKEYTVLRRRRIRLRFLTDMTQDNILYCKDFMKITELRHLDGIDGNFGLVDEK